MFEVCVGIGSRLLVTRDRLLRRLTPVSQGCRFAIPGNGNDLDAAFVTPTHATAALLICHGIGETVEHWPRAQALLAEAGLASLVFNYSGFGRSAGRVRPEQCERDALAACDWLRTRTPGLPTFLLGFSLGTGVATAISGRVAPCGLVLCAAFTSFREAAEQLGLQPKWFADVWPSVRTLAGSSVPLLVVHGERDGLFPVAMGRALAEAGGGELAIVAKMRHPDLHSEARMPDWQVVVDWVRSHSAR